MAAPEASEGGAWATLQGRVTRKKSCDVAWKAALDAASDAIESSSDAALLRQLARDGRTEELRQELRERTSGGGLLLDVLDDSGMSALHWAAHKGHLECVRALLASGA